MLPDRCIMYRSGNVSVPTYYNDYLATIHFDENNRDAAVKIVGKFRGWDTENNEDIKKIDDYLSAHGLVRCHRSYIVNPRHVKMLSRNKEGVIEAELSSPLLDPIPVSKQYYEHLSSLL